MKIRGCLPLWCFVAVVVLAFANPDIYTDFHNNGLLHAIKSWAKTVAISVLLAAVLLALSMPSALFSWLFSWFFSRRGVTAGDLRFLLLLFGCCAVAIELMLLFFSWKSYLDGAENFRICVFSCPSDK